MHGKSIFQNFAKEDSDVEEERRAAESGAKNFPNGLWSQLKNPRGTEPTIDVWEFKMDGEAVTMTFTCREEMFQMYFTSKSTVDYEIRPNHWIPRLNSMYAALRTRLFSLPKSVTINRLVISSTPECEVEDCLLELQLIKSWTCKELEYNIFREFTRPQHLRRLVHMFKPSEITVALKFGPYVDDHRNHHHHQNHHHRRSHQDRNGSHNHLAALSDMSVELQRDFQWDCDQAAKDPQRTHLTNLYTQAVQGKRFGMEMLRTLCSIRKFVQMMVDRKMAQTKGVCVKKFVVKGPSGDRSCSNLAQLLRQEKKADGDAKKTGFANGEMMFVCVRNDSPRPLNCSISMSTTAFKMDFGNEQLLGFTKTVPHFHCCFRTNVDEKGVIAMVTEWQKGERQIDEIQLQIAAPIDAYFLNHLGAELNNPIWVKVFRNLLGKKQTLYIDRDRLATRHLSIRVKESK